LNTLKFLNKLVLWTATSRRGGGLDELAAHCPAQPVELTARPPGQYAVVAGGGATWPGARKAGTMNDPVSCVDKQRLN
jgi:hypothetical protein